MGSEMCIRDRINKREGGERNSKKRKKDAEGRKRNGSEGREN